MAVDTEEGIDQGERDDLLDAGQIGRELRVNAKTVRRWMADGQLPYSKIGRRRLVRRAWLETFIDARLGQ